MQKFFDSVSSIYAQGGAGQHRFAVGHAVCASVAASPQVRLQTVPCSSATGAPTRYPVSPVLANLFLHYAFDVWIAGVPVSGSSAMSMTRSCTASASARPARCWPRCRQGSPSGCGCIPTTRMVCSRRRATRRPHFRAGRVLRSWATRSAARCAGRERDVLVSFAAISKDALKKMGRRCGPGACTAEPRNTYCKELRTVGQSSCRWMQYYGAFYRSGAVSAPDAHQRLPDAFRCARISPVPGTPRVPAGVAAGHPQYPRFFTPTGSGQPPSRRPGDQGDKTGCGSRGSRTDLLGAEVKPSGHRPAQGPAIRAAGDCAPTSWPAIRWLARTLAVGDPIAGWIPWTNRARTPSADQGPGTG